MTQQGKPRKEDAKGKGKFSQKSRARDRVAERRSRAADFDRPQSKREAWTAPS